MAVPLTTGGVEGAAVLDERRIPPVKAGFFFVLITEIS